MNYFCAFNDRIKLFGIAILVPKAAIFLLSLIDQISYLITIFLHFVGRDFNRTVFIPYWSDAGLWFLASGS